MWKTFIDFDRDYLICQEKTLQIYGLNSGKKEQKTILHSRKKEQQDFLFIKIIKY
jgi:hypothetical protein